MAVGDDGAEPPDVHVYPSTKQDTTCCLSATILVIDHRQGCAREGEQADGNRWRTAGKLDVAGDPGGGGRGASNLGVASGSRWGWWQEGTTGNVKAGGGRSWAEGSRRRTPKALP